VRVYFQRQHDGNRTYSWNGRTLYPSTDYYESHLHDVAHWLVATPAQRKHPEFGLGSDPYRLSDARPVVSMKAAERIEDRTCLMQMVLVLALGLDTKAVTQETQYTLPSLAALRRFRRRYAHLLAHSMWDAAETAYVTVAAHAKYASLAKNTKIVTRDLNHIHTQLQEWQSRFQTAVTTLNELTLQLHEAQQQLQTTTVLRQLQQVHVDSKHARTEVSGG